MTDPHDPAESDPPGGVDEDEPLEDEGTDAVEPDRVTPRDARPALGETNTYDPGGEVR